MRWPRRVALAALGVVLLVGAAAAGVLWVIGTEPGTTWLVRRLLAEVPEVPAGVAAIAS